MTPVPWNFSELSLRTERLQLRPVRESDAPAILAIRSNPAVMRYGSSGPWSELEQAEAWVAHNIAAMAAGDNLRLALVPFGQDEIVGSCLLFCFDRQSRRAEVGYELSPSHWHKGYMQEALTALLGYGFSMLGLNRVEADIHPDNLASARALERQGFVREGCLRERWIVEGEVSDTIYYGLLAREWRGGK
jgi:RimJ/RimL family protein N-acetyltransferase